MEETERQCNGEERGDVESRTGQSVTAGEPGTASTWRNDQCVASVSTSTRFTPTFDFSHCRTLLETKGFRIPAEEREGALRLALDHPSVRRYLLFNSHILNVIMVLYVVLCTRPFTCTSMAAQQSSGCSLCVSVWCPVILTAAINLIFHYSNKEIYMNTDVRLVEVNEHMVRHKLLLGVADWVQKCRGKLQVIAQQLLVTYSALYVRLLVSNKLPAPPQQGQIIPLPVCVCVSMWS